VGGNSGEGFEAHDLALDLGHALQRFPVSAPSAVKIAWVKARALHFRGRLYAGLLPARPSKKLGIVIQGLLGVGPWTLLFLGAQLHSRHKQGDPFCVSIVLNADARLLGDFRQNPTARVYVEEIEAMLAHEMVHVADRKRGAVVTDVDPRSDPHGYYGSKAELRAYGEQAVVEVVNLARQDGMGVRDLPLLLRRSQTYRQLGGRVPDSVRAGIRRRIIRALQDAE
jgi:hypothetical protein